MTKSRYDFAIIDKATGKIVLRYEPRATDDIVTQFVERLKTKGVGLFRTTNHVAGDAQTALEELIFELKARVTPTDED